jgi:hypothetical protein
VEENHLSGEKLIAEVGGKCSAATLIKYEQDLVRALEFELGVAHPRDLLRGLMEDYKTFCARQGQPLEKALLDALYDRAHKALSAQELSGESYRNYVPAAELPQSKSQSVGAEGYSAADLGAAALLQAEALGATPHSLPVRQYLAQRFGDSRGMQAERFNERVAADDVPDYTTEEGGALLADIIGRIKSAAQWGQKKKKKKGTEDRALGTGN